MPSRYTPTTIVLFHCIKITEGCGFVITVTSHERQCLKSLACRLFVQQFVQTNIKETSSSVLLALCEGNALVSGGFPSQRASNAESVSII